MTAGGHVQSRLSDTRQRALEALKDSAVLMVDGHFDYGNGFHGRVYVNPHQLFRQPSMIWRFGQDLLDVVPYDLVTAADVVAGPVTGGALLAHTLAGLIDSRRSLSHPRCEFAPFNYDPERGLRLRRFYASAIAGRRVLLADDVRNTGKTFDHCATLVRAAGAEVVGTVEIYDRLESVVDLGVPNIALVEYRAPGNYAADRCPLCRDGVPFTTF
jgi:orotate phosphoribosyltransferase